jgi:uncharacterized cysteine cluster protein YcgN (CxxCxxCC family)
MDHEEKLMLQLSPGHISKPCPAKKARESSRGKPRAKSFGHQKPCGASPFWTEKTLEELTPGEWESLCDGCGRCCLVKIEDEDSGKVYFTDISCKLFDPATCRCGDYARRRRKVHDCIQLTPAKVRSLSWLPPTCAYRLVAEGRDLPWWHPLVSGSKTSVHEAGASVRGRIAASERDVPVSAYPDYIVTWPMRKVRAPATRHSKPQGNSGRQRG